MSNYTESTQYLARKFVEGYLQNTPLNWTLRDQENLERALETFLDGLPLCSEDELEELRDAAESDKVLEEVQSERDDLEEKLSEAEAKLEQIKSKLTELAA